MIKISPFLFIATVVTVLSVTSNISAQSYVFGSGSLGFSNYDNLNKIVGSFNTAQSHRLNNFGMLAGYEIGLGKYSDQTMMEAKWASIGQRLDSNIPNNPIENASVEYRYNYFSYAFGYRPFPKTYFTFGGALNLGQLSLRHSFGGDWIVSNEDYMAGTDLFVDYAFPIKLKKRRNPYLLRIRPYYQQMFGTMSLRHFDANINESALSAASKGEQNLNHFGVRLSLVIPLRKDPPLQKRPKVSMDKQFL
jgi:hypothetical protein